MALVYDPAYFFCNNLNDAKKVILTPCGGLNVDERWKLETEWLIEHIKFDNDEELVIDYGCGIGRLAKEIKNPVLGVDFSPSMRVHAEAYVGKDSFSVITPEMLQVLFNNGLRISNVLSIWAFQHIINIEEVIDMLMKAMKPGGTLWLVDMIKRNIPCFIDDSPKPTYDSKFTQVYVCDDEKEILPMIDKWCDIESAELMPIYTSDVRTELIKYRRR